MPNNKPSKAKRQLKIEDLKRAEKKLTESEMEQVKGGAQMNMQFLAIQSPQAVQTDKPRDSETASK